MPIPKAGRPYARGYGFDDPDGGLPWQWAQERLQACRNYFVATTRPDGRPHAMPVWGVWSDDNVFYFSTSIESVKSVNLKANPRMAITVERGPDAVIVEGVADIVHSDDIPAYIPSYEEKYDTKLQDDYLWRMRPTVAFGFIEDESFAQTATKWRFD